MTHLPSLRARRHRVERGYSLVELVVAMAIAAFLLVGLFTVFQGTRHTSTEQTGLAELQDEERLAMTLISEIVQSAGYDPNVSDPPATAAPVDGGNFTTPGQALFGTVISSTSETITVRFQTLSNDTTLNCNGATNSSGSPQISSNTFALVTTGNVTQLTCNAQWGPAAGGTPATGTTVMPLVSNVTGMKFLYAVNTTGTDSTIGPNVLATNNNPTNSRCPADTYKTTAQMKVSGSINDWTNVCAVQVNLTFLNPLYQPQGQPNPTPGQPQYIKFQRVVSIGAKSGVNTTNVTQTNGNSTSSGT